MLILADRDIADVGELFAPLGELRLFTARTLVPAMLRDADVLLVRSPTRVDAAWLADARVRFVGSATAGIDHVAADWLAQRGIAFAHAPGSNACAVTDYVTAALFELAAKHGRDLATCTLGVVGFGHVGTRVVARAESLGMQVVRNDPLLAAQTGDARLWPIEEVWASADIISIHVPLTQAGRWPTHGMIDANWLGRLKPGALFINTSRGDVVDDSALLAAIIAGRLSGAALDVWMNEPAINRALAEAVDIATPHIAGYSREARRAGSLMVRDALCRWLGRELPAAPISKPVGPLVLSGLDLQTIRRVLDLPALTAALRASVANPSAPPFDALRRSQQNRANLTA